MPNFSLDFRDKTVLITGAGQGIGKALALAFASTHAKIVVNDLNPDRIDNLVDELKALGIQAVGFTGDISNRYQASALIERARDAFGQIHFLINAAGVFKAEPIARVDEWDIRRQIEVNVIGTFFMLQLMSRVMTEEGGGVILNLSSTAGHPNPLPLGVGYTTSKAGVIGLTKQAALELAPAKIRVNALCFGNVQEPDMPMIETPKNAMQRIGDLSEVAQVALFLCSDAASFITGQAINVDGGESYL